MTQRYTKTYDPAGGDDSMEPDPDGDWVLFRDVAATEQARDTGGLREAAQRVVDTEDQFVQTYAAADGRAADAAMQALRAALSQGAAHEERGLDIGWICPNPSMHYARLATPEQARDTGGLREALEIASELIDASAAWDECRHGQDIWECTEFDESEEGCADRSRREFIRAALSQGAAHEEGTT